MALLNEIANQAVGTLVTFTVVLAVGAVYYYSTTLGLLPEFLSGVWQVFVGAIMLLSLGGTAILGMRLFFEA